MGKSNGSKIISPETRERMKAAQRKRMEEGRHNFHPGHPLYGGGIAENMRDKPSPRLGVPHSEASKAVMSAKKKALYEAEPERLEQMRQFSLGRKQSPETIAKRFAWHDGYRHSDETRLKISTTLRARAHLRKDWKGGVTPENRRIRRSPAFRQWREAVFTRDDWTCQHCGQRGGILHPDHIKPFAQYPELRFDVDNGRTLCKSCHMKTDTWGAGPKKKR